MSRSNKSWGTASRVVQKPIINNNAKSALEVWNMDRLTPREIKKTKVNKFSYMGMTVIQRNGKK